MNINPLQGNGFTSVTNSGLNTEPGSNTNANTELPEDDSVTISPEAVALADGLNSDSNSSVTPPTGNGIYPPPPDYP